MNYFAPVLKSSFERLEKSLVQEKLKELLRQIGHVEAPQERYQHLIAAGPPDELSAEAALGEKMIEEHDTLTEKVVAFLRRFQLYEDGLYFIEEMESLRQRENLSTTTN